MKQSVRKQPIHFLLFAFIIATICLFASSAAYAESESDYDVSNVTTIIIGDSYGQMSYGGIKDGVEVDPGTRNDGFANCWTGRLAAKLGLSDVLLKKVKSTETNEDFNLFEDNILYSASGRGFCEYVSGTTYMTMVSELSEYTDPAKVRWIILGGGANDAKFYEQTKFRTRTVQLIETAHDIYPNAKIVLAQMGWGKYAEGMLPDNYIRYGKWDDMIQLGVEKLDPDLRDICEDYCYACYAGNIGKEALSGQEEAFFTGKIVNSDHYEQADPIHPNYLGSEALAKCLYEKLPTMVFEHNWGEVSYEWADDGLSCIATAICKNDGTVVTEKGSITSYESTAPSCEQMGKTLYTATFTDFIFNAQTKEIENIKALDHDFQVIDETEKNPTCTETGKKADKKCRRCDYMEKGEAIEATGHNYGEWNVVKNATCVEKGYKERICSNCGYLDKEEIPARGHTWKHYKKAMGLHKDGIEYDYCTTCKKKKNVKTLVGYAIYYVKSFKVTSSKRSLTAKWTKQSVANQKKFNGYQIRYSLKYNMGAAKYVKEKKSSKSKKIKGLKKKTKYYVQVRTYTKKNGTTFYSKWSKKKSVKTK